MGVGGKPTGARKILNSLKCYSVCQAPASRYVGVGFKELTGGSSVGGGGVGVHPQAGAARVIRATEMHVITEDGHDDYSTFIQVQLLLFLVLCVCVGGGGAH